MTKETQWQVLNNAETVAYTAVHRILVKAQEAISHRGIFKLVLAGGTTPKRIYELLSEQNQEWSKWHLFIGDERCLPENDPERNSLMIKQSWLDKLKLSPDFMTTNFHPIQAELGPDTGAEQYAKIIEEYLPFDLTLLGIGEDGHTASLFPGHEHQQTELTHAVYNSPKPPLERITLSQKSIARSEQVMILITGSNKKQAVKQWQEEITEAQDIKSEQSPEPSESLPVARVKAMNRVNVLIAQDALPETK